MKPALKRPRWYDRVAVVLALAIVAAVTIGTARGREVDVQLEDPRPPAKPRVTVPARMG